MSVPRPRRIVGVSTKMYFSAAQTKQYVADLLQHLQPDQQLLDRVDVFIIPDHVTLVSVIDQLKGTKILAGAQDSFYEDKGAYTGEVSPAVLSEVGTKIVELGHAERRRIFGETDVEAAKKAAAAVRNKMIPLVCIGEKTKGEVSIAVDECRTQVEAVMNAVGDEAEVILAYEPVWAIGASEPAGADHVVGVTQAIRKLCAGRKGTTRLLYGGSAGPGLFEKLVDGVDGLFLGRSVPMSEQYHWQRTMLTHHQQIRP